MLARGVGTVNQFAKSNCNRGKFCPNRRHELSEIALGTAQSYFAAPASDFLGAAGLFCSLEGGTIFFSRRYVTMLP